MGLVDREIRTEKKKGFLKIDKHQGIYEIRNRVEIDLSEEKNSRTI